MLILYVILEIKQITHYSPFTHSTNSSRNEQLVPSASKLKLVQLIHIQSRNSAHKLVQHIATVRSSKIQRQLSPKSFPKNRSSPHSREALSPYACTVHQSRWYTHTSIPPPKIFRLSQDPPPLLPIARISRLTSPEGSFYMSFRYTRTTTCQPRAYIRGKIDFARRADKPCVCRTILKEEEKKKRK